MAKEVLRSGKENIPLLSFEELLTRWHALQEGQEEHYVVAGTTGRPVASPGLPDNKKGLRLLVLKAEPSYDFDDNNDATRAGLSYNAYEYVTDLVAIEALLAEYDDEYFEKEVAAGNQYIPANDFILAHSRKPKPLAEVTIETTPAAPTTERVARFIDKRQAEQRAIESRETSVAYLATTAPYLQSLQQAARGDRINDPDLWRFVRTHEARFSNLNILSALDTREAGAAFSDLKVANGVVITESESTARGKNLTGPVEDPGKKLKTLTIRFLQKTKVMGDDDIVTEIGTEQAQDIASVQYEIAQLSEQPSEFGELLRKHGFEQVRLEDISWRQRPGYGGNYQIVVLFEGNFVSKE